MHLGYATVKEWRSAWIGELAAWRDKPATRKALDSFDALGGSEVDRSKTLYRIADASLHAMHYNPKQDPGQQYREQMAHQRRKLDELARAARTLAKACERGDRAMMWALPGNKGKLGAKLSRTADGRSVPYLEIGAEWFTELERALNGTFPELHGGPFLHRFTLGNLRFERPLQAGRPIEVSSMLAFELSLFLRRFTAGRAGNVVNKNGERPPRPPTGGKPCTAVVAAFCNAALNTKLNSRQVADRLRKLPADVWLIDWPKAE